MALSPQALAAALECDVDAPPPSEAVVAAVTCEVARARRDKAADAA